MFTYKLKVGHAASGIVVPLDSPHMAAAADAITAGFGKPPVLIRSGGSIPIVSQFKDRLGVDTLLLGWGQNDDNTHSPNEKFSVEDFQRGIVASAHLWQAMADHAQLSRTSASKDLS
ncbi:MAG: M20/M25/M40 family metallo-hydrolase [Planctomycetaceae bacterium]|nr:M20/M25/M40 family metallo-hydrolase [Planctomycetaceae bacterium]